MNSSSGTGSGSVSLVTGSPSGGSCSSGGGLSGRFSVPCVGCSLMSLISSSLPLPVGNVAQRAFAVVKAGVLASGQDGEVRDTVVRRVRVSVVDDLVLGQEASELGRHHATSEMHRRAIATVDEPAPSAEAETALEVGSAASGAPSPGALPRAEPALRVAA